MKKLFLLTVTLLVVSTLSAQEKKDLFQEKKENRFYISFSQGLLTTYDENKYGMAGEMVTIGYKVHQDVRIDLNANIGYASNNYYGSFSLLATLLSTNKSNNLVADVSLGVGLQEFEAYKNPEFIIPVQVSLGYKVSESFTVGVVVQYSYPVTKGWNYLKNNSVGFSGLYISFAF